MKKYKKMSVSRLWLIPSLRQVRGRILIERREIMKFSKSEKMFSGTVKKNTKTAEDHQYWLIQKDYPFVR